MKILALGIVAVIATLTGCASTGKIAPQYINPNTYQAHDCQTLQQEVTRVTNIISQTQKQQFSLASTGVGIGLTGGRGGIYPTISIGMGSGSSQRAAKNNTLSKLYGEHDAMIIAARQKSCGFATGVKIYGE